MPYKDPNNPKRLRYLKDYKSKRRKENLGEVRKYFRDAAKRFRQKHRLECLEHYGGRPPKCDCCSETRLEFLTMDHINGGGTKHRKEIGATGSELYLWLWRNDYPEGFRVLCMNCNFALGHSGYCPHKPLYKQSGFRIGVERKPLNGGDGPV